jgi:DnaK suppressor protein
MEAERARALLARERQRIEHALRAAAPQDTGELATRELADQASDLTDAELDAGRVDELRAELAAVERAERRLTEGTYGRSVESGAVIPDERLEANPIAERTAEEQARFERGR